MMRSQNYSSLLRCLFYTYDFNNKVSQIYTSLAMLAWDAVTKMEVKSKASL